MPHDIVTPFLKGLQMSAAYDHTPAPFPLEIYDGVAPKRLTAWFLDLAFTALLSAPLVLPLMALGAILIFPLILIPAIWCITSFVYRWATISNHSGTWGMRIMAIELRDISGQRLSSGMAFMHTLGSTLSFGTTVVQVVSMLMMVTTQKGQGLTDMVLGTTMINKTA